MTGWYVRITIGNDEFKTGDRRIIGLDVTLSENARASTCNFEVYDPGLKIGGRYFLESYESGGIQVPSDLLEAPKPPVSAGGVATIGAVSTGSFTAGQEQNERIIIAECIRQGVTDPSHVAYILATAYHESDRFNTLEEYADGSAYEGRDDLGNNQPGDGPRYKGRGYVQLTGRVNYEKYAELTGKPLVEQPEILQQDAGLAAFVLVHGSKTGHFTGVSLDDFGSGGSFDFVGARAIINGDVATNGGMIADYAQEYLARIQSGALPLSSTATTPTPPPAPPAIVDTAKPEPAEAEKKTEAKPAAPSPKGTEIIVELGTNPAQLIGWHFIHTGTTVSGRSPDTTKFEGKCIRWEMSRRNVNATWEDITLRELAEIVAEAFGRDLLMEGDGPKYAALDATGISLYELLLRECKAIGYRIYDEGNAIVLEPYRPQFSGFVITRQILIGMPSSVDRATGDSYRSASPDPPNPATPTEQAAESVLEIDPLSGEIKQVAPENSTGTGDLNTAVLTGNAIAPIHGVVATPPQGENTAAAITTATATEIIPNNPLPAYRGILPESVTGLPTQQIGAIDLADGTAQAEAIADESRRVMSYETQVEIKTTPASLTLVPGQIIAIAEDCFENRTARDAWCKEWRISQVQRSFKSGSISTTLSIYTPQAQKPPQPQTTQAGATTSGGAATGGQVSTNVEGCKVIQGVPFLSQRDNAQNPVSSCNVTSLAMCLLFLGATQKNPSKRFPDELQDEMEARGLDRQSHGDLATIAEAYNISAIGGDAFYDEIKQSIDAGKPMVGAAWFTGPGHIVCVTGYCPDASGNVEAVICNDPWGDWTTGYSNHAGTSVKYSRSELEGIAFSAVVRF